MSHPQFRIDSRDVVPSSLQHVILLPTCTFRCCRQANATILEHSIVVDPIRYGIIGVGSRASLDDDE